MSILDVQPFHSASMIDPGDQRIAKFSIRKASGIFVLVLIVTLTAMAFWPAFESPAMP